MLYYYEWLKHKTSGQTKEKWNGNIREKMEEDLKVHMYIKFRIALISSYLMPAYYWSVWPKYGISRYLLTKVSHNQLRTKAVQPFKC
jgi:hypothetical protein